MKVINSIITGIASIFKNSSKVDVNTILKKYTVKEENVKESLQKSWGAVGTAIKGTIDNYEEAENNYR